MRKINLIKKFNELLLTDGSSKEFKQSVFGSHIEPCDGWRIVSNNCEKVTVEKHPNTYLIYLSINDNEVARQRLTKEEGMTLINKFTE